MGYVVVLTFFIFRAGPMVGLLLIAIGTGGIKPCVSAFGGDQFEYGEVCLELGLFSVSTWLGQFEILTSFTARRLSKVT